jgi:holo-[acyl-carrier protein] synthase
MVMMSSPGYLEPSLAQRVVGKGFSQAGVRVGIDLCVIADVAESLRQFGDGYRRRVYTNGELEYCSAEPALEAQRLAARFAAKEATLKVLRPRGWWPDWRTIEVSRHPDGWCELQLVGAAACLAAEREIVALSVSLTHEGPLAAAVVVGQLDGALLNSVGRSR